MSKAYFNLSKSIFKWCIFHPPNTNVLMIIVPFHQIRDELTGALLWLPRIPTIFRNGSLRLKHVSSCVMLGRRILILYYNVLQKINKCFTKTKDVVLFGRKHILNAVDLFSFRICYPLFSSINFFEYIGSKLIHIHFFTFVTCVNYKAILSDLHLLQNNFCVSLIIQKKVIILRRAMSLWNKENNT